MKRPSAQVVSISQLPGAAALTPAVKTNPILHFSQVSESVQEIQLSMHTTGGAIHI